jgi:hypothetical protein
MEILIAPEDRASTIEKLLRMEDEPFLLGLRYPLTDQATQRGLGRQKLAIRMDNNARDNQEWFAIRNAGLVNVE